MAKGIERTRPKPKKRRSYSEVPPVQLKVKVQVLIRQFLIKGYFFLAVLADRTTGGG